MSALGLEVHVEAIHVGLNVKPKDRVWRAWIELGGTHVYSAGYIKAEHPYQAEKLVVSEFASRLERACDDPPPYEGD